MKKLLLLGVGSALAFTIGGVGPAQADNGPHVSTAAIAGTAAGNTFVTIAGAGAGRCASCHRAHTAKAEYLLKSAQPALCYTCHGGTGSNTDVRDGISNVANVGLRGGGFENAAISTGAATKELGILNVTTGRIPAVNQIIPVLGSPLPTTSRHQINGTTSGTIWGNGINGSGAGKTGVTLECGSCHDPHGNGNYRILRPVPNDAATKADTTVNPNVAAFAVAAVNVPDATLGDTVVAGVVTARVRKYTTTNYWNTGDSQVPAGGTALTTDATHLAGTGPAATDGYIQNIAAWCTTCHTRYLAPTGSYKTPSGDATFMYRHRSDANYKQGAANCITCHVSHGSNAAMTLDAAQVLEPGANPTTDTAPVLNSRLLRVNERGTCVMCHNV